MTPEVLELSFIAATVSAFLIGLSFGSGPCNLSCLPYLGPVLLGPSVDRAFTAVILPFMGGRLLGYCSLGVLAAVFGQVIQDYLEHPSIPLLAAGVTLWLALKLWYQANKPICSPSHLKDKTHSSDIIATDKMAGQVQKNKSRLQLFGLGFSLALNPCIPLLGLLSAAAQSANWVWGGAMAFSFGLGAIVIPTLLVRYGVALLGKELRTHLSQWQSSLTKTGAVMLVMVAVNTAWRGIPG